MKSGVHGKQEGRKKSDVSGAVEPKYGYKKQIIERSFYPIK